jgi:hypothetical protein
MSRAAWSLVLVCTIAIAVSEDPWALATVGTELLNVSADGDGTDDSPERCPACFSGSVGYTRLRSFVRKPADAVEPVDLRSGYCLGCSPRGPPGNRSNNPGLPESSWSTPAAIDAPMAGVFPPAATPHYTSLDPKDPGTPENPRTLYAGGWGVLMSTDGRAIWRAPVPPPPTDTAPPEPSGLSADSRKVNSRRARVPSLTRRREKEPTDSASAPLTTTGSRTARPRSSAGRSVSEAHDRLGQQLER